MKTSSVYCLATDESDAVRKVERLKSAGFEEDDISVLLPEPPATEDDVRPLVAEGHTKAGAAIGALTCAALAVLGATGALALPGGSLLAAAGPFVAGLCGAVTGSVLGIAAVIAAEVLAHEIAEVHVRHGSRVHPHFEPGR